MFARWVHRFPSTGRWTSRTTTRFASFAEAIHANHPSMDVVMNIAGVSAWGTVDRLTHEQWTKMISINLMGPIHVIETSCPRWWRRAMADTWSKRVLGGRADRVTVACGLQRKQIRATRTLRSAAVRPGPPTGSGCRWWCPVRCGRPWSTPSRSPASTATTRR